MIKGIPPLSEQEERECLEKYLKTKNQDALNKLILSNQGFVYNIAKKALSKIYATVKNPTNIIEIDDLINTGNMGLIRAINTFDLSKKTRLLTYAGYWIWAMINLYIKKELCNEQNEIESNENQDMTNESFIIDLNLEDEENKIEMSFILKQISSYLSPEESLYLYNMLEATEINLEPEDIANITFKPPTRFASGTKNNIKKKLRNKKIDKCLKKSKK